MLWSKLNFNSVIYNHYNEILWNNSNIRIDERTVFYKNWFQSGIKYVKDIFDNEQQAYYTFRKLQDNYNLPNTDYLRYLSLVNSIAKDWKSKLRRENSNIPTETKILSQLKNTTQTNKFIYNCFMKSNLILEITSEIKWNEIFSGEDLQWKNIYTTIFKSTNDIKLRTFLYKYLMRIIPTNQFLVKCHIVSSTLVNFVIWRLKLFYIFFGNALMYNNFGCHCQIFCNSVTSIQILI